MKYLCIDLSHGPISVQLHIWNRLDMSFNAKKVSVCKKCVIIESSNIRRNLVVLFLRGKLSPTSECALTLRAFGSTRRRLEFSRIASGKSRSYQRVGPSIRA